MRHLYKYLLLISAVCLLASCEITDEVLERSDSSIANKLQADRDHSGQTVSPSGPNHITGDANYDSNCRLTVTRECTLPGSYACQVTLAGSFTGYKAYTSQKDLTVKEALYYLAGRAEEENTSVNIVQCGLDNVEKNLYILPCNGKSYGDITMLRLPSKSSEGFDGTVGIAKTVYSDGCTNVTFSPAEFAYKCGFFHIPNPAAYNDAAIAIYLDIDGQSRPASIEETTVQWQNPGRERGVAATRAIDASGQLSNKVTRVTVY